jgi:hypothetical protein
MCPHGLSAWSGIVPNTLWGAAAEWEVSKVIAPLAFPGIQPQAVCDAALFVTKLYLSSRAKRGILVFAPSGNTAAQARPNIPRFSGTPPISGAVLRPLSDPGFLHLGGP